MNRLIRFLQERAAQERAPGAVDHVVLFLREMREKHTVLVRRPVTKPNGPWTAGKRLLAEPFVRIELVTRRGADLAVKGEAMLSYAAWERWLRQRNTRHIYVRDKLRAAGVLLPEYETNKYQNKHRDTKHVSLAAGTGTMDVGRERVVGINLRGDSRLSEFLQVPKK